MPLKFHKRLVSLLIAIAMFPGARVFAQTSSVPPGTLRSLSTPAPTPTPGADRLTPSELEELLGPIALYPDPLLANVLAASVYPDEVAEAAAFIAGGGKSEQVDAKQWEDPVKAVAKIPDAIKMMGQYNDWTIAVGQAYLIQAKDVMDVVQSLRKKAQDNGALQTSPQQKIVVEQQTIYIKPADPEVIYVPSYAPSTVYVEDNSDDVVAAGVIGFGLGVATGLILANNLDCDWHGGCVGYGWHGGGYRGGNNQININGDVNIGNRNTNISGNNVRNTANVGNRVGNEGNAWAPNRSKSLASARPSQLNQFKGGGTSANRAAVPGGGRTAGANNANRAIARPGAQPSARPGGQAGARPAQQPTARPGAQPSQRPGALPANRPSAQPRPAGPAASPRVPATPPRQSNPGAFSGGRDTQAASNRGAASRAQSPARSSGGAARSAPARQSGAARSAPARSSGARRR